MERCPVELETLVDYREGLADAATDARVRAHLDAGCAECESRLAWLERTLPALGRTALSHAPEALLSRARALFREQNRPQDRPSWIARLVFDSRAQATPAFARGTASAAFQRLYSAADYDIDLWEEQEAGAESYLIGQVLPKEGGEAIRPDAVTLTAEDGRIVTAQSDAGEFHLPEIAAGVYQLRLRLPKGEILVPDVQVGS